MGSDVHLLLGSTNRRKIREWRLMQERIVEIVDPLQLGLTVDAVQPVGSLYLLSYPIGRSDRRWHGC